MARLLYDSLWLLTLPLALARLYWRGRREPGYRQNIRERLARAADSAAFHGAWWIHAVSVGETRAAQPIVEGLLARDPTARVLLTQLTPTGRRTARELYGAHRERVRIVYLPYDLRTYARRFFDAYRPRAGVLMETEIWPNFVLEARARGLPLLLANARLSERSARRYRRLGGFAREVFGALGAVAAQSADDARRIEALGAQRVAVTGSVKFDVLPPPDHAQRTAQLSAMLAGRNTLLAASTREGEEAAILEAFAARSGANDLLLLVPRHPQRFDEVAALVARAGLALQRRSEGRPVAAETRVLLGDSMGEMFAYYAVAKAAMIGGSWQPLGGQNLIEACAVGTPVVVGPHTFNFAEVTRLALEAGAAVQAPEPDAGIARLREIATDSVLHAQMAAAASDFAQRHRGATRRTIELLDALAGPVRR